MFYNIELDQKSCLVSQKEKRKIVKKLIILTDLQTCQCMRLSESCYKLKCKTIAIGTYLHKSLQLYNHHGTMHTAMIKMSG